MNAHARYRGHVNEDLLPFACVSTTCWGSPSFAHRSDWRDHTKEYHGNYDGGESIEILVPRLEGSSASQCPFGCRSLFEPDPTTNSAIDLIMNHIAEHLQCLSLLTLRLSPGQLEKEDTENLPGPKALTISHHATTTLLFDFRTHGNPPSIRHLSRPRRAVGRGCAVVLDHHDCACHLVHRR
mgnify:CR=1 FL=1